MQQNDLIISEGSTFLISDQKGDIGDSLYHGLVFDDMRHLSTYKLRIDDNPAEVLTSKEIGFNSSFCVLRNFPTFALSQDSLSIVRRRIIRGGLYETIEIVNNSDLVLKFDAKLIFDVDFADISEVKTCNHKGDCSLPNKRGIGLSINKKDKEVKFSYKRDNFIRETKIGFSRLPLLEKNEASFSLALRPKQQWRLSVVVSFFDEKRGLFVAPIHRYNTQQGIDDITSAVDEWQWSIPKLETDWDDLGHAYTKSVLDLAALRIKSREILGKKMNLPAAGMPWFMTIFGRDSLITAYQTIVLGEHLGVGALRTLSKYQGKKIDRLSEEEPGKILHEMRFGETARFEKWVKFPYYGTADATPLFLILLSEVYRFTGDKDFINTMKKPAIAALLWIDQYGDIDGDGFVEYRRKSKLGLENQNWRDSKDSMIRSDGTLAEPPIAASDVQGYVYDAKRRIAEIAREVWQDNKLARKLEDEAEKLKQQFNKNFWIEKKLYFALGIDRKKQQIDSLNSAIGHLLWSGIVEKQKIPQLVEHLFSKNLYSGWGVRTLSRDAKGYNPITYHRGTVWPHDNSLIAAGLHNAGYQDKALKIAQDMINAASFFNYRLPEVFAGYDRSLVPFPVQYPTASSPQAWAAGTPILLLRLLLGIEPDTKTKTLKIKPTLPKNIRFIRLNGVSAFGKHFLVEAIHRKSSILEVKEWVCHICKTNVKEGHRHNKR